MRRSRTLLRWHVWLGWLIGVPLLFWAVSGVVMTLRPIEDVRGTPLRAELPPLPTLTAVPPVLPGTAIVSLQLKQTALGPRWIVTGAGEAKYAADPRDGHRLGPLDAVQARGAALAYRRGRVRIVGLSRSDAAHPPLDLRQPRPAWGVRFADGARFYIDADTGELLAVRTDFWRFYDFLWGLHIMDLQGREDSHHPVLLLFAILAAGGTLLGCVLMVTRHLPRRTSS